jgi:hypothetical protein
MFFIKYFSLLFIVSAVFAECLCGLASNQQQQEEEGEAAVKDNKEKKGGDFWNGLVLDYDNTAGVGGAFHHPSPIFCLPGNVSAGGPLNLLYCVLYLAASIFVTGAGFYLYFRRALVQVQRQLSNAKDNDKEEIKEANKEKVSFIEEKQ